MNFHNRSVLRTPLLPYSATITEDFDMYLQNKIVQEAIYIASPVLFDEIQKYLSGELTDTKKVQKLKVSVQKYLRRITSRPTPFGLFGTCGVLGTDENTVLSIPLPSVVRTHTRFDMYYLCELAKYLEKVEPIRYALRYASNSSMYQKHKQFRYVEYIYTSDKRAHKISEFEHSEYLACIITACNDGMMLGQIAQVFKTTFSEFEDEEVFAFLNELIENQILVSELEPNVSGLEYLEAMIATLTEAQQRIGQVLPFVEALQMLNTKLKALDQIPVGQRIEGFERIIAIVAQLPVKFDKTKLFQVDAFKDIEIENTTISNDIAKDLQDVFNFLKHFNSPSNNGTLRNFHDVFMKRYEIREMPLLEVLDVETGIGYPPQESRDNSIFLDGLAIPQPPTKSRSYSNITWGDYEKFLFALLEKAKKEGARVIDLSKEKVEDFSDFAKKEIDTATLTTMYSIVGEENGKPLIDLSSASTSSPSMLLGRFAHGSEAIRHIVEETTAIEEDYYSDRIMAEIIHVPEDRVGNVLLHPTFLKYEIPYLGKSSVEEVNQIRLEDLYVSIDHSGVLQRISLKSKRLGKEIMPRLSNAHNRMASVQPVYRFLCDMETQNKSFWLGFSWSGLTSLYKHFPRVVYKNIILEKATWYLQKTDFEQILKVENNDKFLNIILPWRAKYELPERIILADGDNELQVDLTDAFSVIMFIDVIKKRQAIQLKEFIFDAKTCPVKDTDGNAYVNQFVSVFTNQPKGKNEKQELSIKNNEEITRYFQVGSEWLYYKFYCGNQSVDVILKEIIGSGVQEFDEKKWIDQWFFIRYRDPDNHIRLRLHLTDTKHLGSVMLAINSKLEVFFKENIIWKIQTDTYQREIERYGTDTIEVAEKVFHIDSESIVSLLENVENDEDEDLRWKYTLASMDAYMNFFGMDLEEKKVFCEKRREQFGKEFGLNKTLSEQLNDKFRLLRSQINEILKDENGLISNILHQRTEKMITIFSEIDNKSDYQKFLESYLHMSVNRTFKTNQRAYEFVAYHNLMKHYISEIGVLKNKLQKDVVA